MKVVVVAEEGGCAESDLRLIVVARSGGCGDSLVMLLMET